MRKFSLLQLCMSFIIVLNDSYFIFSDPSASMTMQQLINERLKVRAVLIGLKDRPHASMAATAQVMRDKMRAINAAIQVCSSLVAFCLLFIGCQRPFL